MNENKFKITLKYWLSRPLCMLLFVLCAMPLAIQASPMLEDIELGALSDDRVVLRFKFSEPVKVTPQTFSTDSPPRIIIDFMGVANKITEVKEIATGSVKSVSVVGIPGQSRAVIDLNQAAKYDIHADGNYVDIELGAIASVEADSRTVEYFPESTAPGATKAHEVTDVNFHRDESGGGLVVIDVSDPNMGVDVRQEGGQLVVDFVDTKVATKLENRYDVRDFGTPLQYFDLQSRGKNVQMRINATGHYEHLAYQVDDKFIVDIKPLTEEQVQAAALAKPVYTGERLSLNFQDIQVRAVLQLLAEFTGINIVVSDTVSGSMTLRLHNVPWDQALDIVLKTQGLDKRQVGNVMLVAPASEIAAREKQELEANQQIAELEPLRAELIQLNYAKAGEIADLLKAEDNTLLSARGNVSVDERTNTIWVQDTTTKLQEIRQLIMRLDIPVRQVLIDARVVSIEKNFTKDLGVRFGITDVDTLSGTFEGANSMRGGTDPAEVTADSRLNFDIPVNASKSPGRIGLALARLSAETFLDLELSALETENVAEIISSPRIITSDQQKASIESGEEIPYLTSSSSGATTVSFKKAVLRLEVTPQITPDNRIILELTVTKDTRGESVTASGPPAVDTNEVETRVLIDNGETIVLGGVYEKTMRDDIQRVPFLGNLPVLGSFFRNRAQIDERKELLIFVTPRIIQQSYTR